jgi:hypothetical protein
MWIAVVRARIRFCGYSGVDTAVAGIGRSTHFVTNTGSVVTTMINVTDMARPKLDDPTVRIAFRMKRSAMSGGRIRLRTATAPFQSCSVSLVRTRQHSQARRQHHRNLLKAGSSDPRAATLAARAGRRRNRRARCRGRRHPRNPPRLMAIRRDHLRPRTTVSGATRNRTTPPAHPGGGCHVVPVDHYLGFMRRSLVVAAWGHR